MQISRVQPRTFRDCSYVHFICSGVVAAVLARVSLVGQCWVPHAANKRTAAQDCLLAITAVLPGCDAVDPSCAPFLFVIFQVSQYLFICQVCCLIS